jgi:hypothetical protein
MKLFDYYRDYDYGHDIYFTVGQFKNFNILDAEFHTTEYWSWEPDIHFALGILTGALFTMGFGAGSFSFNLRFIPYRFPSDLSRTREL